MALSIYVFFTHRRRLFTQISPDPCSCQWRPPGQFAGKCAPRLSQDGFPLGLHSNCLRRKKVKQICINSGRRPEEPGRGRPFHIPWYAPRRLRPLTCSSLVASERINCHFLQATVDKVELWWESFPMQGGPGMEGGFQSESTSSETRLHFYICKFNRCDV